MKALQIFLINLLFFLIVGTISAQGVKKVVIDPGHGGKDPGAVSASGYYEKTVALNVSLMLGDYIESNFPDVEVIYTRNTDVFIELYERANIANRNEADLFISIHANAAANKGAYGAETFVLGLHKSDANLEVAKRENSVIEMEDNTEDHYQFDINSPEGHIMLSLLQDASLNQSIELAHLVQTQFTERVGRKDRGVKQAGFAVLYKTTMPSILVELGFLSNVDEEEFLKSDLGQDYLASALFRAFRDYKENIDALWVENNDVNSQEEEVEELTYRIQVFASKFRASDKSQIFTDFNDVFIEDNGAGVFRHMVNEYASYEDASKDILDVVKKGYEGAYIVSYLGDERKEVFDAAASVE
ncbi:MAG: N-acetylmuramoyl-L-alanine amidase family protein [Chitinophagales bacterium]